MSDTQTLQPAEVADSSQQVTSNNPITKSKNPKQVAAGKVITAKSEKNCEEQKKALAEACVITANN